MAASHNKRRRHVRHGKGDAMTRKLIARTVIVLVVLLVCCALPPIVVSAPVGYLPLVCVIVLLVVDFAYLLVLRHRLDYMASFDIDRCVRKSTALLTLHLANEGILPMMRLEPVFFMEDSEHASRHETTTSTVLNGRETAKFDLELHFDHIGTYDAGVSRVRVFDPLGLFFVTVRKPAEASVVVEPLLSPVHLENLDRIVMTQSLRMAKPTSSDDMDYAGARAYAMGDPMKSIHWKLSARTRELMTRLFETYTNPTVTIILDMKAPDLETEERLEVNDALVEGALSLERAARLQSMDTVVLCADAKGELVTYRAGALTTTGIDARELVSVLPMPSPQAGTVPCLEELERQTMNPSARSTALVYCTADLTDELAGALVDLQGAYGNPALFLACPMGQEEACRRRYRGQIARLEDADIACAVVAQASELTIG